MGKARKYAAGMAAGGAALAAFGIWLVASYHRVRSSGLILAGLLIFGRAAHQWIRLGGANQDRGDR